MSTKDYHQESEDYAGVWSRVEWKKIPKYFNIAYLKSVKFARKVQNHNWKKEGERLENSFYANKAVYAGASSELPFKTLTLLGKLKTEKMFQSEINQIIESNIIKYQGEFIKLDDLDKQPKIRKILRGYHFDHFEKVDIAA